MLNLLTANDPSLGPFCSRVTDQIVNLSVIGHGECHCKLVWSTCYVESRLAVRHRDERGQFSVKLADRSNGILSS